MSNIEKKLKRFGFELSLVKNITTDLEDSLEDEVCFYRIRNKKAEDIFKERFSKSKGFVFTNKKVVDSEKVFEVSENDFLTIQYELAQRLYPGINEKKIIGVTGTNGKTSVVNFCSQVLNNQKKNTLSLGTLGVLKNNKLVKKVSSTTPSYVNVLRWVFELGQDVEFILIEVSSHALKQKRLGPLRLDVVGWTNITQDHLDYHKTMDDYFNSKLMILDQNKAKEILVPETQKKLVNMIESKNKNVCKVKINSENKNVPLAFQLNFNRENVSLAQRLVEKLLNMAVEVNYNDLRLPAGRFETFAYRKSHFVVDYAHTPDALESVLRESKKAFSTCSIGVVFGCGGDRDKDKRAKMGQIANKYADRIILTSDNPRSEKPLEIIADIKKGIALDFLEVEVIEDRKKAIAYAMETTKDNEIVIIAGKGHEDYQEVNGQFFSMSDAETVKQNIKVLS